MHDTNGRRGAPGSRRVARPQTPRERNPLTVQDLPGVARWQAGVFTRAQALDEGWSQRQVRRRIATGAWQTLLGRGLIESGPPPGPLQRCWAVHLTWPDRTLSHRSAAALHGWPVDDLGLVDVLAEREIFGAGGLRVHRGGLGPGDLAQLDGQLLLTAAGRTMLDCFTTMPTGEALDLYAWLMSRGVIDRPALVVGLHERHGLPGVVRLRTLLELTLGGAVSGGEYELHRLLRAAGIGGWEANVRMAVDGRTVIADVYFAAERVAIEFDGRRAHTDPEAFVRDRRRQNAMQRSGILVLRYTWDDLRDRPDAVLAEILAVLVSRGRP